jgi:hypothetical protein
MNPSIHHRIYNIIEEVDRTESPTHLRRNLVEGLCDIFSWFGKIFNVGNVPTRSEMIVIDGRSSVIPKIVGSQYTAATSQNG